MELLRLIDEYLATGGGPCALATVVDTVGPAYRRAGARQIIGPDGRSWGAITGGCVESDLILRAIDVIARNEPAIARYSPSDDDPVFGLGSGCGGEIVVLLESKSESAMRALRAQLAAPRDGNDSVLTTHRAADARLLGTRVGRAETATSDILVQPITRPLSLVIFGASPAAAPLMHLAKQLGWKVTIGDHRPVVREDERFAAAEEFLIGPVEELAGRVAWTSPSAAVVMTHHFVRDLELLRALLPRDLAYLGLVGSRDRAERMIAALRSLGTESEYLTRLRAPAGLDLASDTPSEIALSIIAEIQATQRGTSAAPLRDRRGSIHDNARRNAVVILAAGGSRRMGSPKQLLAIDGQSLIRRAAETAIAIGGASVYVVAGADQDRIREEISALPVEVIVNPAWQEGIASSIRAAVGTLERQNRPIETLTFMLCDQPGVSASVLERLIEARRITRAPVVASRYPDGPGVPALFGAEMFGALKSLRGDVGARQFIRNLDREIVTIPFDAAVDIDTPADLASYAKRASINDPSDIAVPST
jgi:xanthine/CO dehydrogenase XdhC/CoxF family maturation factor/CTP:molybdopterin cytidylyltransferase MocA